MARTDTKIIKDLISLAEGQGWEVKRTNNGHLRFMPPDKTIPAVVSSGTHSTRRGIANLTAELKRAGLLFPDNAGRPPEPTQRERRLEEGVDRLRAVLKAAIEWTDPTSADLFVIDSLSPDGLTMLSLLINERGRIDLTCKCGSTLHRLMGFMRHLAKCSEGSGELVDQYVQFEEEAMKRDMHNPPQREKAQCPDCPEWFWISQPHLLQQHMAGEHGKQQCPYCQEWHTMRNGSLTKHIGSCDKAPKNMPPPAVATVLPFDGRRQPKRRPDPIVASTARPERFAAHEEEAIPLEPLTGDASRRAVPVGKDRADGVKEPVDDVKERPSDVDEPEASSDGLTPFVWRRVGQKVTATVYHLYRDCGMAATAGVMTDEGVGVEHVDVDDTIIGLLGLRCCRACDRRSKKITVEQMVTEWFATMDEAAPRDELALQFLLDIAEYGYKIVKGKP